MGSNNPLPGITNSGISQVDNNGNVITAGCYFDTIDFDPGPGVCLLNGSVYVQKLDSSGQFVWAKTLNVPGRINDLTLDANNNIYVTGHFSLTADFDPGPGVFSLTCQGAVTDIFILKLDAGGNFIWAKSMGGMSEDWGCSIAADPFGNIYCCGHYNQSADLDPGPGVCNVTTANSAFFIVKLNNAGNFIWGRSMGFGDIFSYVDYQIKCDRKGNIYTTGRFDNTADFDPGPLVYNMTTAGLNTDVFIQKLDSAGNFIWAKSIDGSQLEVCNSFAIDKNNNIYTTGFFTGTADFDPGPGIANLSTSYTAGFIQKLDVNGNFLWAAFTGSDSTTVIPTSIDVDTNNDAYVTGWFYRTIDFDPGAGTSFLSTADSSTSVYIQKLDATGNFCWAKSMGTHNYYSVSNSIVVDDKNNIYTTGSFSDTVDFDFGTGVHNLTSLGSADIFIQKLSQCLHMQLDLGNDTVVCEGSNFVLNASIKNASYEWQDHSTDSFFIPGKTGLYSVNATSGNCKNSDSIFVQVDKPVNVNLGNDTVLCEGEILRLSAGNSYANYLWQNNSTDSVFEVKYTGKYMVKVSNSCGTDSDEVGITFENCECIFIPNSFTPNGDGLNDNFSPVIRCNISDYSMKIFNRWGEQVFESNYPDYYWNGKFKEENASTGVYVYELKYREQSRSEVFNRHGHISLIR
jgi:gliding motility-associated-like protein